MDQCLKNALFALLGGGVSANRGKWCFVELCRRQAQRTILPEGIACDRALAAAVKTRQRRRGMQL